MQNNAYSLHSQCCEQGKKSSAVQSPWLAKLGSQGLVANAWFRKTLAVSSDGTKFTGKEMIRWPRSADRYLTVLQLLGSGGVAVLIFFDALGIDQVSDVD